MARLFWAALLGAGIALEAVALRHQRKELERARQGVPTLSATCRWFFHTDTRAGRLLFAAFWGALSAWFVPHIVRGVADSAQPDTEI